MSDFMQPEITVKQFGWQIETCDAGTCFIPGDVVSVPDYIVPGKPIDASCPDGIFSAFCAVVADYIPAHHIESIEVCRGYFARLSAPGYLDCTEWECHKTLRSARESLRD